MSANVTDQSGVWALNATMEKAPVSAQRTPDSLLDIRLWLRQALAVTDRYEFQDNLGYLLNRCASQIAARFSKELEPYGISLAQWGALLAIQSSAEATPSEIADRVGIDRGATTRLLARMEDKGLIERKRHVDDGRAVTIRLSKKTADLMPELVARSKAVNAEVLGILPPSKAKELLEMLARLNAGLMSNT